MGKIKKVKKKRRCKFDAPGKQCGLEKFGIDSGKIQRGDTVTYTDPALLLKEMEEKYGKDAGRNKKSEK